MKICKKVIALILSVITVFSVMTASLPSTVGRCTPLSSVGTITAYAASGTWKQQNGNWYYVLSSGSNATYWNEIDGYWYYFNGSGVMQTGWLKDSSGKYFYLRPAKSGSYPMGSMVTGWLEIDSKWYYFSPSKTASLSKGQMVTYWQQINGEWYYFTGNGNMNTGWFKDGSDNYFYLRPTKSGNHPIGSAVTGWLQLSGKWYYFSPNKTAVYAVCQMVTGWNEISGKWYCFDGSGALQTGWIGSKENGWFYADSDGVMQTGWQKIEGYWYYFVPTADGTYKLGQMVKGSYTINGKTYVFNSDGTAFSGVWNGVYYKDGSPIENGWTTIDDKYVYIQDGVMLTNTWLDDDGKWYYLNSDGTMKKNEWFKYTDKNGTTGWYYLQSDGSAATGEHRIDGKNYRFNFNGFMLKEEAPSVSSSTYVNYIDTPYSYWSPFRNAYKTYQLHKIGNQYAYCLQFNRSSRTGDKTPQTLTDTDAWKGLSETAKTGVTRATIVGYPNYDLGVSNATAAAAATAMVIHEYQMGYRTYCSTSGPGAGLDSSVNNSDVLYNMAYKQGGALWTAYSNITKNIANFAVKPSFSGKTYVIKENDGTYTYTLTDTKGVLSDYVVAYTTNRNLTATINGNKLTVTSSEKLKTVNVVLSKKGTTASTQKYGSAVALFDNSNYQTLVYGSLFEAANATVKFTFEEEVVYGSLEITKINELKEPLAGAEFVLINNATGNVYATLTTNSSGKATLSNIPVGKYTLKETQAPSEYYLTSEKREFEVKKNSNNSFKYTIINRKVEEKPKGDLYIFKRDQLSNKVMSGAKFNIYANENIYSDVNNTVIEYQKGDLIENKSPVVLNDDGFAVVNRLYVGKYYAVEIEAPIGFKINPEKQYFEIKENTREFTAIPSVTLDAANTYDDVAGVYEYGRVTVNVENAASASDKVAGAIINAYYLNGDGEDILVGTAVTDENGSAVFNNIAYGLEYTFVQAKNMNTSYLASAEEYAVTLDDEKTSDTVTFKNALSPDASVIEAVTMLSVFDEPFSVTLFKKDKETLQGLSGAIINVYNADGDTVYSGKTDEDGAFTIKGIPAGEYTFEEIQAPDGYVLNTLVQSFTVAEDGTVSGDDTVLNEKTVVTLHKTDLTTAEGVPGATIVITDTDGEAVFEDVTNEDGDITVIGLNPGTYYFKETVAPSGYIENTTVFEFTLNRDGTIEGDDTITNQPTAVVIQKFAEDTNLPQPNAEFEFFNSDGESIGKFLTNEDGEIAFSKLPIGSYTYKETRAPEGYALNTTVFAFTINEDGSVTGDTTVIDVPITVIVQKVEKGTDKPLKDAEFEFFNTEGESIGKFVTNDDGEIVLTKLSVGAYTYKETKAPEGYVLDDKTVYSFEIAEDGTVTGTLKVENEEEPKFKMPKTGAQGLLLMGGLAIGCFLASIFISKKKKTDGESAETN